MSAAGFRSGPMLLVACLALPAALATFAGLGDLLPPSLWARALTSPDLGDPRQVAFAYGAAPRSVVAMLAGAALGLSGTLLQQSLRNPIAEPATLGTFAGAGLALSAAALFAPWTLADGRDLVALAGAAAATALAFALAGRAISPVRLILGGLVVTLICGAATASLVSMMSDDMTPLFVWQSGSLAPDGGPAATDLAWRLALGLACALALARPLALLGIDDAAAASLGAPAGLTRMAAVALAVALAASVASIVGVIGFVGLAAPALARLVGAHGAKARLVWSPLIGGSLLWLVDRMTLLLPFPSEIPTGAVTALLGAPLVMLLLGRLKHEAPGAPAGAVAANASSRLTWSMLGLCLAAAVVAVCLGRGGGGWAWSWPMLDEATALRAPRVAAAFGAGALLSIAGVILQRVTANPLAAPETLGVSSGAMLGVLVSLLVAPGFDRIWTLAAATTGALGALLLILAVGRRSGLTPDRVLLAGVAITTMATGFAALFLASGDPRVMAVHAWIAGSTYRTSALEAALGVAAAVAALALAPLARRWLEMFSLGEISAGALGLSVPQARAALLLFAAVATAAATIIMGPLSFVGLMAPHAARLAGFRRAAPQIVVAGLGGGTLLILADFLGRNLIFPWQIPAGVVAALVGGAYLLLQITRDR